MASLFTSRWPSEHGAISSDHPLPASFPTLAERLQTAGYETIGVSGNFVQVTESTGLAQGFDAWHAFSRPAGDAEDILWTSEAPDGTEVRIRAPTAEEINRVVDGLLPEPSPQPFFLYVHYMEPHSPYAPHGEANSGVSNDHIIDLASRRSVLDATERDALLSLYDQEIEAVDAGVGELQGLLESRGLWHDTVVAITSDHGEEFGEHGGWFHGLALHRESLRVPLVFHGEGRIPGAVRRDDAVDLLDVPTTLLALAGVPPAEDMRGRSLLDPEPGRPRDRIAELHRDPHFEAHVGPRRHRVAITRWPWKAIVAPDGRLQVHHLEQDPTERAPLPAGRAPAGFIAEARERARAMRAEERSEPATPLDPTTRERLRALGYAE